jgi:hypothetical protein
MVESIKLFSSSRNTRKKMEKNILNFKVAQSQFIERLELNHESVLRFDS